MMKFYFLHARMITNLQKLTSAFQTLNDHKGGYVGRGKSKSENAISGKDIRKFGYKK